MLQTLRKNEYATHSDFCAVFRQQLDRLFLLALLLTGDELSAERCLLTSFDTCVHESRVFRESAPSWSRRCVIKTAIRLALPAPRNPSRPSLVGNRTGLSLDRDVSLKWMQELPLFERFVFVMSVLERYPDRECALLLGCSCADVLPARIRAFQQVSRGEKSYPNYGGEAQPYLLDADSLECG